MDSAAFKVNQPAQFTSVNFGNNEIDEHRRERKNPDNPVARPDDVASSRKPGHPVISGEAFAAMPEADQDKVALDMAGRAEDDGVFDKLPEFIKDRVAKLDDAVIQAARLAATAFADVSFEDGGNEGVNPAPRDRSTVAFEQRAANNAPMMQPPADEDAGPKVFAPGAKAEYAAFNATRAEAMPPVSKPGEAAQSET